jgi:hypothetical protein
MEIGNMPEGSGTRNRAEATCLLTPEQRAFAEIVGREIARFWRESRHGREDDGNQGAKSDLAHNATDSR